MDNNKVELTLEDLYTEQEEKYFNVTVDALYIRTGTLNKVREITLNNEYNFSGIIDYGTNNGKQERDFIDKIVTVIGFGATAIENINNANFFQKS